MTPPNTPLGPDGHDIMPHAGHTGHEAMKILGDPTQKVIQAVVIQLFPPNTGSLTNQQKIAAHRSQQHALPLAIQALVQSQTAPFSQYLRVFLEHTLDGRINMDIQDLVKNVAEYREVRRMEQSNPLIAQYGRPPLRDITADQITQSVEKIITGHLSRLPLNDRDVLEQRFEAVFPKALERYRKYSATRDLSQCGEYYTNENIGATRTILLSDPGSSDLRLQIFGQ